MQRPVNLRRKHFHTLCYEPRPHISEEIIGKLNAAANKALISPQVTSRFAELNVATRPTTPAEFGAYVEAQMALWSRVVKDANIKLG